MCVRVQLPAGGTALLGKEKSGEGQACVPGSWPGAVPPVPRKNGLSPVGAGIGSGSSYVSLLDFLTFPQWTEAFKQKGLTKASRAPRPPRARCGGDLGFLFLSLRVSPIPSSKPVAPWSSARSCRHRPRSPRSSSSRLPLSMTSVMMYTGSPTDATAYSARMCLCRSFFMAWISAWKVCWCKRSSAGEGGLSGCSLLPPPHPPTLSECGCPAGTPRLPRPGCQGRHDLVPGHPSTLPAVSRTPDTISAHIWPTPAQVRYGAGTTPSMFPGPGALVLPREIVDQPFPISSDLAILVVFRLH